MLSAGGSLPIKNIKSDYFRIIVTRRPSIPLYKDIVSEDKFAVLNYIESLTNNRIREEKNETAFVPECEKVFCQNSSLIMKCFTNLSESRFSSGSYGVFYAAKKLECAVSETKYRTLKFAQATDESTYECQQRVLTGNLAGLFCDIRSLALVDVYSPDDYTAGQVFGKKIKDEGNDGIVYDSVRHKGGTCFAVFKPSLIKSIKEIKTLTYLYDGKKITVVEDSSSTGR